MSGPRVIWCIVGMLVIFGDVLAYKDWEFSARLPNPSNSISSHQQFKTAQEHFLRIKRDVQKLTLKPDLVNTDHHSVKQKRSANPSVADLRQRIEQRRIEALCKYCSMSELRMKRAICKRCIQNTSQNENTTPVSETQEIVPDNNLKTPEPKLKNNKRIPEITEKSNILPKSSINDDISKSSQIESKQDPVFVDKTNIFPRKTNAMDAEVNLNSLKTNSNVRDSVIRLIKSPFLSKYGEMPRPETDGAAHVPSDINAEKSKNNGEEKENIENERETHYSDVGSKNTESKSADFTIPEVLKQRLQNNLLKLKNVHNINIHNPDITNSENLRTKRLKTTHENIPEKLEPQIKLPQPNTVENSNITASNRNTKQIIQSFNQEINNNAGYLDISSLDDDDNLDVLGSPVQSEIPTFSKNTNQNLEKSSPTDEMNQNSANDELKNFVGLQQNANQENIIQNTYPVPFQYKMHPRGKVEYINGKWVYTKTPPHKPPYVTKHRWDEFGLPLNNIHHQSNEETIAKTAEDNQPIVGKEAPTTHVIQSVPMSLAENSLTYANNINLEDENLNKVNKYENKEEQQHEINKSEENKFEQDKHEEGRHEESEFGEDKHEEFKHENQFEKYKFEQNTHGNDNHEESKFAENTHGELKHEDQFEENKSEQNKHEEDKHEESKLGEDKHRDLTHKDQYEQNKFEQNKHEKGRHEENKHGELKHEELKHVNQFEKYKFEQNTHGNDSHEESKFEENTNEELKHENQFEENKSEQDKHEDERHEESKSGEDKHRALTRENQNEENKSEQDNREEDKHEESKFEEGKHEENKFEEEKNLLAVSPLDTFNHSTEESKDEEINTQIFHDLPVKQIDKSPVFQDTLGLNIDSNSSSEEENLNKATENNLDEQTNNLYDMIRQYEEELAQFYNSRKVFYQKFDDTLRAPKNEDILGTSMPVTSNSENFTELTTNPNENLVSNNPDSKSSSEESEENVFTMTPIPNEEDITDRIPLNNSDLQNFTAITTTARTTTPDEFVQLKQMMDQIPMKSQSYCNKQTYLRHPRIKVTYDENGRCKLVLEEPPKPPYFTKHKWDEYGMPITSTTKFEKEIDFTFDKNSATTETTDNILATTDSPVEATTPKILFSFSKFTGPVKRLTRSTKSTLLKNDLFLKNLNMHPEIDDKKYENIKNDILGMTNKNLEHRGSDYQNGYDSSKQLPADNKISLHDMEMTNIQSRDSDNDKSSSENVASKQIRFAENKINLPLILKQNGDGTFELALDSSSMCKNSKYSSENNNIIQGGSESPKSCPCLEKFLFKRKIEDELYKHPLNIVNILKKHTDLSSTQINNFLREAKENTSNMDLKEQLYKYLINDELYKLFDSLEIPVKNSEEIHSYIDNLSKPEKMELKKYLLESLPISNNAETRLRQNRELAKNHDYHKFSGTEFMENRLKNEIANLQNLYKKTTDSPHRFNFNLQTNENEDSYSDSEENGIRKLLTNFIAKLKKSHEHKHKLIDRISHPLGHWQDVYNKVIGKRHNVIDDDFEEDDTDNNSSDVDPHGIIKKKYKIVNNILQWARDIMVHNNTVKS